MKLDDIKAIVDSYFDSISEQDLFNLLTNKYHMPIVYDIDLFPFGNEIAEKSFMGFTDIQYESCSTEYYVEKITKIESSNICDLIMNTEDTCVSCSLSLAA
ncbi:hypothetical protein [Bacteroides acidifaciens]|jgi:hypothetical protein|uniref:hypothetical protein n=1 Tax=Bacteroides acidifaciens TaxID=85831 RepID=UPI00258E06F4|nr:hypothetical protein [Bacteroides acidifaciens]